MITKFAASAYKEFSEDLAARFPHLYHQMMEDLAQPYRNPEIVARNPKLLEKVLPRIQGQLHNK